MGGPVEMRRGRLACDFVRFPPDYVRSTPNNRHSRRGQELPELTQNHHLDPSSLCPLTGRSGRSGAERVRLLIAEAVEELWVTPLRSIEIE